MRLLRRTTLYSRRQNGDKLTEREEGKRSKERRKYNLDVARLGQSGFRQFSYHQAIS